MATTGQRKNTARDGTSWDRSSRRVPSTSSIGSRLIWHSSSNRQNVFGVTFYLGRELVVDAQRSWDCRVVRHDRDGCGCPGSWRSRSGSSFGARGLGGSRADSCASTAIGVGVIWSVASFYLQLGVGVGMGRWIVLVM